MAVSIYKGVLRSIWFIFLVIYIIMNKHIAYNNMYFYAIVVLYCIALFCFFKIKKKKNYLDFDTLFLSFCSIEHFMGTFFIGTDEYEYLFFRGIDQTVIINATILSALGLCSYMVGGTFVRDHEITIKNAIQVLGYRKDKLGVIFALFCLFAFLFIISGGYSLYENAYKNTSSYVQNSNQVFQSLAIITILSNVYCVVLFLNIIKGVKLSVIQMIHVAIILIFATSLAIVGNRTFFSYIALPFILCYSVYIKNINLVKTLIILVIAVIVMYIIQVTRQGGNEFSNNILFVFSDIVLPSQTLYSSMEYVEKVGFNYGSSMLPSLYGCVPGLSSFLGTTAVTGSAELITRYVETGSVKVGLGTTVIVDIYISFGFVGVVLLMGLLGHFVKMKWKSALTEMIVKCAMFSCCIFMGRSAYFLPARFILWSFVFLFFIYNFWQNGKTSNSLFSR